MFERFLFWLAPNVFGDWKSMFQFILSALARIEKIRPARQRVYVTLRGVYTLDGKKLPHGWTQGVDTEEGSNCSVAFSPYNHFTTERVDVLGPAVILGVQVGNMCQESSPFESPATLEFITECNVGNRVTVHLRGTP